MSRGQLQLQPRWQWPFLGARARWRALPVLALSLALLCLGGLLWQYSAQQQINAELSQRLAELRRRTTNQEPPPPDTAGQAARASIAVALQRPWPELWALLESHAHRDVRLVRLRLSDESPELNLEAQGRQLDVLLEWANRLREDPRVLDLNLNQQSAGEAVEGGDALPGLKLNLRLHGWTRGSR